MHLLKIVSTSYLLLVTIFNPVVSYRKLRSTKDSRAKLRDAKALKLARLNPATLIVLADLPNRCEQNMLTVLVSEYSLLLQNYPVPTKVLSAALVGLVGDCVAQLFELSSRDVTEVVGKKGKFDFRRLLVFDLVAAAYVAPVTHFWFQFLDYVSSKLSTGPTYKALAMVVLDQTLGAIVITTGFFYAFQLAQKLVPRQGKDTEASKRSFLDLANDSLHKNLFPTLLANWCCWPLINFFNFLSVPIEYRLCYIWLVISYTNFRLVPLHFR